MSRPSLYQVKSGKRVLKSTGDSAGVFTLKAAMPADAIVLSKWRQANRQWFMTEFPADPARTRAWIESIRAAPDRLLLIVEADRLPIGHVGLRDINPSGGTAEVDNVLRGKATPETPGLMGLAVKTLVRWVAEELGIRRLCLHVFEDNPACGFYAGLGFAQVGYPSGLSFKGVDGDGEWTPDAFTPARHLLRMELGHPPTLC